MLRGREAQAIPFALAGLLFYFKQFVAAAYATVDFLLIAALSFYRRRYLPGRE